MGGKSSSSTSSTTQVATTQIDKRIGAANQAKVLTGGSKLTEKSSTNITVRNTDAEVIKAALAGTRNLTAEALSFSGRQAEQQAKLTERAIEGTQGELQGLQSLLKSGTAIALVVGAVAIFARR